jgi:hypothetical protein
MTRALDPARVRADALVDTCIFGLWTTTTALMFSAIVVGDPALSAMAGLCIGRMLADVPDTEDKDEL